ncbi:MAG: hypothetical protein ACRDTA_06925 [Pseudonocardiaceae bacterium]
MFSCPLVALHAATGDHDLPVIGLVCLGLAMTARARPVAAGFVLVRPRSSSFVLGVAAALKQAAWPAVAVSVALLAVLTSAPAARRCALTAVATVLGVLIPVLLGPVGPSALAQLAGFPLAASQFAFPAASPTPGVLLASAGSTGRIVGLAILAAAILGIAAWLVSRPPRDLARAAAILALAETIAVLLLPTSRFGYLAFPAVLLFVGRTCTPFTHSSSRATPQ